jgi:crossover junction endodeoxyribonuclease RuvC
MILAGIDPGFSGGITIYDNNTLVDCIIMPIEEKENGKNKINGKEIYRYLTTNKVEIVYLEHVHAFAGQGRTSIWNFGEGVGMVKGVCESIGISYVEISPQRWKKLVLGEKYIHDEKSGAIQFVKDTYPNVNLLKSARCKVPHDGKADSICIGHYGTLMINNIK